MRVRFKQADKKTMAKGLTLVELLVSISLFGGMVGGFIYGYIQVNRMAEWSSMSLAAQSVASQGAEQMFCSQWNKQTDQLTNFMPSVTLFGTNYTLDVPVSGDSIYVTNVITVTQIQNIPPVRQIWSACVWTFPRTGTIYTNTVISLRAMDQ
jgi:type II secretory pathway pseudopilin PulG